MKAKQLDLFKIQHKPVRRKLYIDLDIHRKINIRANSCGFSKIYYSHHRYDIPLRHDDITEYLTYNYFWHYLHNHHSSLETLRWRFKSQQQKLNL